MRSIDGGGGGGGRSGEKRGGKRGGNEGGRRGKGETRGKKRGGRREEGHTGIRGGVCGVQSHFHMGIWRLVGVIRIWRSVFRLKNIYSVKKPGREI